MEIKPRNIKNVKLQNLRDFTVQIRRLVDSTIVGTGIAVSLDGKIVTCSHVVRAAGIDLSLEEVSDEEVEVYFPQANNENEKIYRAYVASRFTQYDDDVVLLKIKSNTVPLGIEQIAVLGSAESSAGHTFRSYGYRLLDDYNAGFADGMIQGRIEKPKGFKLLSEPVQLMSNQINHGMSGAAILDTEANLVVGIVSGTWYPDASTKDRDTAWGVDAQILTISPFDILIKNSSLDRRPLSSPRIDIEDQKYTATLNLNTVWVSAPPLLEDWIGRDDLLSEISTKWAGSTRKIVGLIGLGGEGKSSLARHWLDILSKDSEQPQPNGIFWWSFYSNPSIDEFFETALMFISGEHINPRKIPSTSMKANMVGAMLGNGRYIFVLDGLEVIQYQQGDQYGLLRSDVLQEFLDLFASPEHDSFCLITSRAPLIGLLPYTTYAQFEITGLNVREGLSLLKAMGVYGNEDAMKKMVLNWGGHALTLSLLGGYLAEQYDGDFSYAHDLPAPVEDESRYERVHKVLNRYDRQLSKTERFFLMIFSAFRMPVPVSSLDLVFFPLIAHSLEESNLVKKSGFGDLLSRLVGYRILQYDSLANTYNIHPLVRSYYFTCLNNDFDINIKNVHTKIKDYYIYLAGEVSVNPTLDELRPLIEAVHHSCEAGDYDEGYRIYLDRIDQGKRWVLATQLAAIETQLSILQEFFPQVDTKQESMVSTGSAKGVILNEVGYGLMCLGRLHESESFYKRSIVVSTEESNWLDASITSRNLSDLYINLGMMTDAKRLAHQSMSWASESKNLNQKSKALCCYAWTAHLNGELPNSLEAFQDAIRLQTEVDSSNEYLLGISGVRYARHLFSTGKIEDAYTVIDMNLNASKSILWVHCLCHSLLGDFFSTSKQNNKAQKYYDEAVRLARSIPFRVSLIESLLSRGRWQVGQKREIALNDLEEALKYAIASGYRIHEADIRLVLIKVHLFSRNISLALAEAERVYSISKPIGYYWGVIGAKEVLEKYSDL